MIRKILLVLIILGISSYGWSQGKKSKEIETKVRIHTTMGDIVVKLYNETPQTRDNFIKLVKEKFYDSTLFHRVIKTFMIQAGDPNSKKAAPGVMLGNGDAGYTVPAEIMPDLFHKKGAIAMARQSDEVNPTKASSGCQFYIVQGKVYRSGELDTIEFRMNLGIKQQIFTKLINMPQNVALRNKFIKFRDQSNIDSLQALTKTIEPTIDSIYEKSPKFKFSDEERKVYTTVGGTQQLDGNYTVFGEVVQGLDVVDKIAGVQIGKYDRPVEDVRILSTEIVK